MLNEYAKCIIPFSQNSVTFVYVISALAFGALMILLTYVASQLGGVLQVKHFTFEKW